MWGLVIAFVIGILVGYFSPGRENKSRLFWIGAIWALVIALVLNIAGWFLDVNPTTAGDDVSGVALFMSFLVSIAVFLVGVWVGDVVEGRRARGALPPTQPRI